MRIRLSADLFYTVVGGWVMQQKDSTQVFHVGSRNSVSEAVTANDETGGVRSRNQVGNPVTAERMCSSATFLTAQPYTCYLIFIMKSFKLTRSLGNTMNTHQLLLSSDTFIHSYSFNSRTPVAAHGRRSTEHLKQLSRENPAPYICIYFIILSDTLLSLIHLHSFAHL